MSKLSPDELKQKENQVNFKFKMPSWIDLAPNATNKTIEGSGAGT